MCGISPLPLLRFQKLSGEPEWAQHSAEASKRRTLGWLQNTHTVCNHSTPVSHHPTAVYHHCVSCPAPVLRVSCSVSLPFAGSEDDSSSAEEDEEDALLQTAGKVLGRSSRLPKGVVDIKRMKNANRAKPAQAVVQSLQFHPHANVLLTAGFHKSLDFFQVHTMLDQ